MFLSGFSKHLMKALRSLRILLMKISLGHTRLQRQRILKVMLIAHDADMEQFKKLVNASRAKKLEKSHDPLALQNDVHNNSEDPLVSAMLLLAKAITQNFSSPTNNHLRASSNTRNQAIIQGDRVNIQSRNSGNTGRNSRRAYVQEEVVEGMNAPKETGNPRVHDSKYFMEQMLLAKQDEADVILTDEQNDFLFADASRMEEIDRTLVQTYA
ncbi:hypothetical protein Tco_0554044 [Tanacetum coccineum]